MSDSQDRSEDASSNANKDSEKSPLLVALQSDLGLLQTGEHSDFVIYCGDRKWRVHKSFLTRCPYYATLLNKERKWKEDTESKSVIEEFEPCEVNWLIRYIYCPVIDANDLINEIPSKSFLEVCVRLWTLGNYFLFNPLMKTAVEQLEHRVGKLMMKATHVATVLRSIPFFDELEAAIRLAWSAGHTDNPVRKRLVALFKTVRPFLRNHTSCIKLLEEVPQFSVDFAKATLGLYGDQWSRVTDTQDDYLHDLCSICCEHMYIALGRPGSDPDTIVALSGYGCEAVCGYCAKGEDFPLNRREDKFHPDCPDCDKLLGQ